MKIYISRLYKKSCGTYIQAPPDSYVLKVEIKWSRSQRKSIQIYEHLCSDIFTWSSYSQEIKIKDNQTPQEVIQKKLIMVQIDSNKSAKTAETLLQLDCFTANTLKNKN